ncbi:helix-turn-helix transcriptional regulator [Psychromarinibacter halotolerans]|uniref:Helix-turn-helix transcriptional regulator n=1 Tax=Psychromarinibacter halotolerans TaxID=1775175 RepID=A0ABV7GJU2_9RHOB|nr:WYL domain-containing protein [Psychromarinibacter halotolerans]MDF0595699.1 HTH domain-containing protein [Psychromarinibacter halotolerans]
MPRTDRLFRLLDLLRRLPPPVTAMRLAAETGVSERTLYRDIDALRAAGALIDGEAGYGYRLTEDPALPPQMFDRLEVEALVLGLAEVQAKADPALADAAAAAMDKIVARLPDRVAQQAAHAVSMVRRWETTRAPRHLDLLRRASWDELAVDITYVDGAGNETGRRIWPLATVFVDHAQMILAWCCLRQEFRKFVVHRITQASVTGHSFRPRRASLLRDYLAQMGAESQS